MEALHDIATSTGKTDTVHRIFEQFLITYHPVLMEVEDYLDSIIEKTDPVYVEGYLPWKEALHELVRGVHFLARKIPLPSRENFIEALCMFSFDSAIDFLLDICSICQLQLEKNWEIKFRENINQLLFSISLYNQHQYSSYQ